MTVKTGTAWSGAFVCLDATGALATPSVGPAGALYVDGVANGASVTISGSNPYKWTLTLPALTAGQRVDMYITATIATIATAAFVASDQADTLLLSDGVTVADYASGKAPLQPTTAGRTLDVSAGGEAGLDWANVGSPTTTVGLSNTTVKTVSDIGTAGASLSAIPWNSAWDAEVQSEVADELDKVMSDSVATDGSIPTLRQAIYMIAQFLFERAVSSTTVTVNKVDGTTALMTFTLDSASAPTTITRAS